MKRAMIIGLMVVAAAGCATAPDSFDGHCYHAALTACAIMESYGYDNRIAIQKTDKSDQGIFHAQCEVFDPAEGKWRWVVLDAYPKAAWGGREHGESVEYWTVERAVEITHNRALKKKRGNQ